MEMSNPQYREAVFSELLSENNMTLSNTNGYIGEIIALPPELRNEAVGYEKSIGKSIYLYKINDEYALKYDGKDASAVMLYEQRQQIQYGRKVIPTRRKLKKQEENEEIKGNGTTNQGIDVDDGSR